MPVSTELVNYIREHPEEIAEILHEIEMSSCYVWAYNPEGEDFAGCPFCNKQMESDSHDEDCPYMRITRLP